MSSGRFDDPGLFNDPGEEFEPSAFDMECAFEGCPRKLTKAEQENNPSKHGWRKATKDGTAWYCPDHAGT